MGCIRLACTTIDQSSAEISRTNFNAPTHENVMRSTTTGMNRTGAVSSATGTRAMMEASNELTPPLALDLAASKTQRARYIAESDAVGSIPPPATLKGMVKTGV